MQPCLDIRHLSTLTIERFRDTSSHTPFRKAPIGSLLGSFGSLVRLHERVLVCSALAASSFSLDEVHDRCRRICPPLPPSNLVKHSDQYTSTLAEFRGHDSEGAEFREQGNLWAGMIQAHVWLTRCLMPDKCAGCNFSQMQLSLASSSSSKNFH